MNFDTTWSSSTSFDPATKPVRYNITRGMFEAIEIIRLVGRAMAVWYMFSRRRPVIKVSYTIKSLVNRLSIKVRGYTNDTNMILRAVNI